MGFSSIRSSRARQREERPWKIHPVWRGIGCALIILVPVMAWAGADIFMEVKPFFEMPKELLDPVIIPVTPNSQANLIIDFFNRLLSGVQYGHFFFTAVFSFLGFGVLSVLYGLFYRIAGPPRYSQFDVKPIRSPKRRRF
jgi:hypothetical protein